MIPSSIWGIDTSTLIFAAAGLTFLIAMLLFMFGPKKGKRKKKRSKTPGTIACLLSIALAISGVLALPQSTSSFSLDDIPEYSGDPYVIINDNIPSFTEDEITTEAYEHYSELDLLGRCGVVEACCGKELMPAEGEERESISSVTPSGWVQAKYDFVDGTYLYNRCHLIGWQLTAENATKENLITGTKYMNTAMIPFENMIADYIKETNNHVMYRVRPIFEGNNLVCSGVLMEAYSVEDDGDGICFNVFMYNVQPNIIIDYSNGASRLAGSVPSEDEVVICDYILNTNSKKIHDPDCTRASTIADKNKKEYTGDIDDLLDDGYTKCAVCNPS